MPLIDPTDILRVVDTNVLLDLYSAHDLTAAARQARIQKMAPATVDSPELVLRRARVRESLLLALPPFEAQRGRDQRHRPGEVDHSRAVEASRRSGHLRHGTDWECG